MRLLNRNLAIAASSYLTRSTETLARYDLLASLIVCRDGSLNTLATRIRCALRELRIELGRFLLTLGLLWIRLGKDDLSLGLALGGRTESKARNSDRY
jgi:hypothetical protein